MSRIVRLHTSAWAVLLLALSCTGDDGDGGGSVDALYDVNDRILEELCECGFCDSLDLSCEREVVEEHEDELASWLSCVTGAARKRERCIADADCDDEALEACFEMQPQAVCDDPPRDVSDEIDREVAERCQDVSVGDGDGDGDGFIDGGDLGTGDFVCANGSRINRLFICDNFDDCGDGSDETIAACTSVGKARFECEDGTAIDPNRVCDSFDHCADGSDETLAACDSVGKVPTEPVTTPMFACLDATAIPLEYVCDTEDDCANGEDEARCFSCGSVSSDTIRLSLVCDGVADCTGGYDESGAGCMSPAAGSFGFVCGNGDTTLAEWVCNGRDDCSKGDDEENCFVCADDPARRLRPTLKCDGITDCADHSDEQDCGPIPSAVEQCAEQAAAGAGELADAACLACSCERSVTETLECGESCWAAIECAYSNCVEVDGGDIASCIYINCPDFMSFTHPVDPFVSATVSACGDVCPTFAAIASAVEPPPEP